ncbi:MAG: 30S ribosomal protein S2 [bacterium]|nr:30S ribosomal protein S2 [bacterium]MDA1024696.1 30S ribosomal protein S2 [bacterium]
MQIPSLTDMLKAGLHFGHRTSRWHPKMAPFIFGARSGVHIIDLESTQQKLEEAMTYIKSIAAKDGKVIFIGTKSQLAPIVEKYAQAAQMPHIHNRWLGGTFTNFEEIEKLIKTYLDLKDKREKGELKKYTKLEQLQFDRKIDELDEKIGGISSLTKLPDAILVFDVRNEKTAIMEARKRGIKVIAVCDTNVNPDLADYVIPANDDAVAGLEMIARVAMEAVQEGRKTKGDKVEA